MGTIKWSQPASKSSWDSQDFGDISVVLKWPIFASLPGHDELIGFWPDNKVHGARMGPTLVLSAPDVPHVGPWTLVSGWLTQRPIHSGSYLSRICRARQKGCRAELSRINVTEGFLNKNITRVKLLKMCKAITDDLNRNGRLNRLEIFIWKSSHASYNPSTG